MPAWGAAGFSARSSCARIRQSGTTTAHPCSHQENCSYGVGLAGNATTTVTTSGCWTFLRAARTPRSATGRRRFRLGADRRRQGHRTRHRRRAGSPPASDGGLPRLIMARTSCTSLGGSGCGTGMPQPTVLRIDGQAQSSIRMGGC